MRILSCFCISMAFCINALSQNSNKHEIYYSDGVVYLEVADSNFKRIGSQPMGKDARVIVDTFFKKYTILFTDVDGKRMNIVLKYVADYFAEKDNPTQHKIYFMKFDEANYRVTDLLDIPKANVLEVMSESPNLQGAYHIFRVLNCKRVTLK